MKLFLTVLVLTILPFSHCAVTQSWPQYIESGSIHPTISLASSASNAFTFNLISTKTNSNYRVALSITGLTQQFYADGGDGRYSIAVSQPSSKTVTSMTISLTTNLPSVQIANLAIRYLTVEDSFIYVDVSHFSQSFSWIAYSSSTPSSYYPIATSYSINQAADYVIHVINGYDIKDPNGAGNQMISLQSHCRINGAQLECLVRSTIGNNCQISFISVDIVVFHQQLMQTNLYGDFSINSFTTATNTQQFSLGVVIDEKILFYGLKQITKQMSSNTPYDFQVGTYSNGLDFTLGNYDQRITAFYMYFVTEITCPSTNQYYDFNTLQCQLCTFIVGCLTCITYDTSVAQCLSCDTGYTLSNGQCSPTCGDGLIIGSETCDDSNTISKDGCDSSCQVEQYFDCGTVTAPISCILTQLDMKVIALSKSSQKNQIVVSIQFYPEGLLLYNSALWSQAFLSFSHSLTLSWVQFDSSTSRLRVALNYNQKLQGQTVSLNTDFSLASSIINIGPISLTLPQKTNTNQALYVYSDQTYVIAKTVNHLALFVVAFSFLMMILGYFGCKLQSLEAIAVVQVAALLLTTLSDISPPYEGLSKLALPLGVTYLNTNAYYYQYSTVPRHIIPLLPSNSPFALINIFLLLIFVPMIVAAITKIHEMTDQKESYLVVKIWKYSLGTYTYYGIMLLAYGEFALFALSLRYFESSLSGGMGIFAGVLFSAIIVFWNIASYHYPVWFGCFKKKFFKFEISQYFYLFSSSQRFITAFIIICISPGIAAAVIPCCIFIAEAIFIVIKKPYISGYWKRPFITKILAAVICILYMVAIQTSAESMINQIIPLLILFVLVVVLVISIIGSIYELYEYWLENSQKQGKDQEHQPPLSVKEAQNMLTQQFEMSLLPKKLENAPGWRPIQQSSNTENSSLKYQWQNYTKLTPSRLSPKLIRIDQEKRINNYDSKKETKVENKEKNSIQLYGQI